MEKRNSVLQVVSVFASLPCFFGDQFRYFKEKGYKIYLVCSESPELENYAEQQQVNYKTVSILRSFSIIQDLKSVFAIMQYIRESNVDVVVGHTPKAALLSMLAAFLMRVPKRIYFRHGLMYETSKGLRRVVLKSVERLTAFCATKIVCVSNSVFDKSISEHLNSKSKQIVLGRGTSYGIDTQRKFNPDFIDIDKLESYRSRYNIASDDFIVGYSGRIVKDKGIAFLVDAIERLSAYPEIKLLLVGYSEERDALPDSIKSIIINHDHIITTGFIPYDDIEYYYALMDIYVLPSYREGFPTSVLEASSIQKPVITTKVTGCVDSIIEGVTGFFVNHDGGEIADCTLKLFNDRELQRKMGKGGRDFVSKNFDHSVLRPIIEKEVYG